MKRLIAWFNTVRADNLRKEKVRKNRARHPDLMKNIWDSEDMVMSGIYMRDRDRLAFWGQGTSDADPRFPVLGDYLYMESPSRWGRRPFEGVVRFWRLLAGTSLTRSI